MVQSNDKRTDGRNRCILPHLGTKHHCQLTKPQKKCRTINVIISDKAKTLHFVGQMYKSDYFTEEQMTQYEMQSDAHKQ